MILHDIKYALRISIRKPWYFLAAVLILALGTGASAIVFTLINAVLLRPIGGSDPSTLVRLYALTSAEKQRRFSYPDFQYYREQGVLQDVTGNSLTPVSINRSQASLAEVVSANYFSVIGVTPQIGRAFLAEEDRIITGRVVVISDRLWDRSFSRGEDVLGKELILNNDTFEIIGVAPEQFTGTYAGSHIDVWVPAGQVNWLGMGALEDREKAVLQLLGRLKPGTTREVAAGGLSAASRRLEQSFPRKNPRTGMEIVEATFLHGSLRKGVSIFLSLMLGIASLVLFTACANLANVALMHATGRRREIAIRGALGASAASLFRQFAAEGLLTSLTGGILGLFVAQWGAAALLSFNPFPSFPLTFDFRPDARILVFQFAISIITGLALGFIPAMHLLRSNLTGALKEESGQVTTGGSRNRLRQALVVLQISITALLLICSGLFVRSLYNVQRLDLGFDPQNAVVTDIDLEGRGLNEQYGIEFYRVVQQRAAALAGVESVTLTDLAPLDIATPRVSIQSPADPAKELRISSNTVGPDYFRTLRIPLLKGRDLTADDREQTRQVCVINETMASQFWSGKDPLEAQIRLASGKLVAVVGVARNVRYRTLGENPEPHIYLPFYQNYQTSMSLLARTSVKPESMLTVIQQTIPATNREVQGFFERTLTQHIGFALLPPRLAAVMSAVMGSLTLILAIVGIYGSIGYSVSLRTREIGIRMALGAKPRDVLVSEMKKGTALTVCGMLGGLLAALGIGRAASSFLYGVSPYDPLTLAAALLFLTAISLLAVYFPARHATRVNPSIALRL